MFLFFFLRLGGGSLKLSSGDSSGGIFCRNVFCGHFCFLVCILSSETDTMNKILGIES